MSTDLNDGQRAALIFLHSALKAATAVGLLDELMADVKDADSINDVCDTVAYRLKSSC